jgi:hypothetical protein
VTPSVEAGIHAPGDLSGLRPREEVVRAGTRMFRCHSKALAPIHWSTGGASRWNDAEDGFGVCYFSRCFVGAFAETLLRQYDTTNLSLGELAKRQMSIYELARDVRLAALHGHGLARLGLNAGITARAPTVAPDGSLVYDVTRAWSRALHGLIQGYDGLTYRARHDDERLSVALYDRAADAIPKRPAETVDLDISHLVGAAVAPDSPVIEVLYLYDVGLVV